MSPCRPGRQRRAVSADADLDTGADRGAADDAVVDVSVADDDVGGDADGADDGERCAGRDDESGRVASRPGFPLQSPLRSDFRCNPSRLRSLRSLRAPLAAAVRCAHRRCRTDTPLPRFDGVVPMTAVASSRRRCAPRSSGRHSVRRRCRLRRPPARALPGAVVSAPVRTPPPSPPAAFCARLPAAPAALPATQSPWRLPSAGFAGVDSPVASRADSRPLTPRRARFSHTPRIDDAGVPPGPLPCPCGVFRGLPGPCGCWSERVSRATRRPSPPCPRLDPPATPRNSRATRRVSDCVRRVSPETRAQLARVAQGLRPAALDAPRRGRAGAQSGASRPSDSWNVRASPTSLSSSASRPSRIISSRFAVARNQV